MSMSTGSNTMNNTKSRDVYCFARFGADRTGIPDYAMGPAGARVITSLTSATYEAVRMDCLLKGCLRNVYTNFWLGRKLSYVSIGTVECHRPRPTQPTQEK